MASSPTKFSKAVAERILKRLAKGETLSSICRDPKLPGRSVVIDWALGNHRQAKAFGFPDKYTHARTIGYYGLADEIQDIADDGHNDWMERHGRDGKSKGWKVNNEAVQRSKLRVDTRKWLLSKALPKIYGDKLQIENNEPALPLEINFTVNKAKGDIKITKGDNDG